MDTRGKILNPEEAVETGRRLRESGRTLSVVTGYFDPLLAAHAGRLAAARAGAGALMVLIRTPERPILPAAARAEMVAALSVVDYVVLPEGNSADDLLSRIPAAEVMRQESDDEQLTRNLIRHVHQRQQAG